MKISDLFFTLFVVVAGVFIVAVEIFVGTLIGHDFFTILLYVLLVTMGDFFILALVTLERR